MAIVFIADSNTGYFPALSTGIIPLQKGGKGNYPGEMLDRTKMSAGYATASKSAILSRIDRQLSDLGISAERACLAAGLGKDVIRDWRRKPKTMPRVDTVASLAPALITTPEWLAFGIGPSGAKRELEVHGEVAAGLWLDLDGVSDAPTYADIPVLPDPRYPADAQYGLLVRGTSINRIAAPGDFLICVSVSDGAIDPQPGDLVVIERRRMQEGRREVTAKRMRRRGNNVELVPDSDDPNWQAPLIFDKYSQTGDEQIAIIAVTTGVYRMIRPR